jgi:hypothetical protein
MLKHVKERHYVIIVINIIAFFGIQAQENYYTVIGLDRKASGQEIRRNCVAKLDEVKRTLEPERAKLQRELDAAKAAKQSDKIKQFETNVAQLHQRIIFIKNACEILQNPKQKIEYDRTLGVITAQETTQAKEAEEIKNYCNAQVTLFEKYKQETEQELKIAQRASLPATQINDLQSGLTQLDNKLREVRTTCQILDNPRHPQYQATLTQVRQAQKQDVEEEKGFFGSITRAVKDARKDADVKIASIIGDVLSTIPIPDASARIFNQNLAMRNMQFISVQSSLLPPKIPTAPRLIIPGREDKRIIIPGEEELGLQQKIRIMGPQIRKGLGFTGTMNFNNFAVKGTVIVVEDTDRKMQYSFSMELPEHYKISSMFPSFKALDVLSLPKGKFVISSFTYTDPDGYSIKPGFNFNASLDLAGPLKVIDDLMKKAKELNSVIVRIEPILFQGVIPKDITKTSLSATIPLRLGIDFTKLPKIPKSVTDIFKEFTTDDLTFAVTAPPKVSFSIEAGVRLVLGTQPDPIRLSVLGIIEPQSLSLGVRMRNMLDLKFIALGNAGVQLDFDQVLLPVAAALGVPFTGIGVHGEVDLGTKGDHRVNLKVAGGVRLSGTSIPDLVLEAAVSNLHFGNIINLVSKVMAKTGIAREIPAEKIPVMNIDRAAGYLVLEDTKIAGKEYKAGFGFALDAQLFDKKFGFTFDIKHKQLIASGIGYMSKIDFRAHGKEIFSFSGPGMPGVTADGPVVYCNFDFSSPQKFLQGTFGLKSLLEIPPIGLSNKVDLQISGKSFRADVEATYVGFTTVFGINIDPEKWREMYVKFGFKGDFAKFLSEQAKPLLEDLKKEAGEKLAQVDKKIGDLSGELNKLKAQGTGQTQQEINKTRATIRRIEGKINALKRECERAGTLAKAWVCPKVGFEIAAQGTALAAQKTYLETLLKPGKKVIEATTGALAQASKAIGDAEIFKKTVTGFLSGVTGAIDLIARGVSIFKVTEAIGEFSAPDLVAGKLPRLISFMAEVNIPELPSVIVTLKDLQFNFKNPKASGLDIAKKLMAGVKLA